MLFNFNVVEHVLSPWIDVIFAYLRDPPHTLKTKDCLNFLCKCSVAFSHLSFSSTWGLFPGVVWRNLVFSHWLLVVHSSWIKSPNRYWSISSALSLALAYLSITAPESCCQNLFLHSYVERQVNSLQPVSFFHLFNGFKNQSHMLYKHYWK